MAFFATQKPPRWGFQAGLVAPEWRWFYDGGGVISSPLWDMGEGAQNLVSNGVDGTFQGTPSWVASLDGPALDFDGSTDYVTFGDIDLSTDELSIIVRVKFPSLTSDERIIAQWGTSAATTAFILWMDTGGSGDGYAFQVKQSSGASETVGVNDVNAIANTWQTVIATYNTLEMSVWVDGVQGQSINPTLPNITDSANNIELGRLAISSPQFMQGQCSLCVVRNKSLTVSQIQQITRDPFGPVRMLDEVEMGVLPAAAVVVVTGGIQPIWRRRRR